MTVKPVYGNNHIIIQLQENIQAELCEPWQLFPWRALEEECGAEEEKDSLNTQGFLYLGERQYYREGTEFLINRLFVILLHLILHQFGCGK